MLEIDLSYLNQCYARRRSWYPDIQTPRHQARRVSGLAAILDQFDLVLLDAYGVLCYHGSPVEGALEAVALLRARNKRFCVVSNDTLANSEQAAHKYAGCGFDLTKDEVITSLDITLSWLNSLPNKDSWGVMAPEAHFDHPQLEGMVHLNTCGETLAPEVDSLLFFSAAGWSPQQQDRLVTAAQHRQFSLAVGNPDVAAPARKDGRDWLYATPGYFLDDMVTRTDQRQSPLLLGKPGGCIFETASRRYGDVPAERVLMVGDTLYTDILGGAAMGFSTLLLESGVYRGVSVESAISEAGIVPDFIAPHL